MTENNKVTTKRKKPHDKGFQAGQSGNPGGRPKKTAEQVDLIAACKGKTQDAIDVLLRIMENGENERNQITAAMAIIERGHGKAVQPTTLEGVSGGEPINHSIKIKFE